MSTRISQSFLKGRQSGHAIDTFEATPTPLYFRVDIYGRRVGCIIHFQMTQCTGRGDYAPLCSSQHPTKGLMIAQLGKNQGVYQSESLNPKSIRSPQLLHCLAKMMGPKLVKKTRYIVIKYIVHNGWVKYLTNIDLNELVTCSNPLLLYSSFCLLQSTTNTFSSFLKQNLPLTSFNYYHFWSPWRRYSLNF